MKFEESSAVILGTLARQSTKDPNHRPKANLTVGPRPLQLAIVSAEKLVLDRCRLATKKKCITGGHDADVRQL